MHGDCRKQSALQLSDLLFFQYFLRIGYNPIYLFLKVKNMKAIFTSLFLLLINTSTLASEFGKGNEEAVRVSMHYLLANPEKFSGQLVSITGVLNLEFESNLIFVDSESFDYYIKQNGFWVDVDGKALGITDEMALALTGKMVEIEGVFYRHVPRMDSCVEKNKKSGTKSCITMRGGQAGRIENVNYLSERIKMN